MHIGARSSIVVIDGPPLGLLSCWRRSVSYRRLLQIPLLLLTGALPIA
jgi:hypothetical protein